MNHHPSQSCIDAYLECVVACENWATACLSEQDVKSMKECNALIVNVLKFVLPLQD